jgi:hypothetical protein
LKLNSSKAHMFPNCFTNAFTSTANPKNMHQQFLFLSDSYIRV